MQAIQLQSAVPMRRWCRRCGLPSLVSEPGCSHCDSTSRAVQPREVNSSGEVVQHFNIEKVENLEVNNDLRDISQSLEAMADSPPAKEPFLRRLLQFTCVVAMWTGILTVSSVVAFFVWVLYMAYMKAHGG